MSRIRITEMIDSHAHLDMGHFEQDREAVIQRALQEGLSHIVTIGTSLSTSIKALELADAHNFIFAAIGCHPHNASSFDEMEIKGLCSLASKEKVVAWGEIGLDFYHRRSSPADQVAVFKKQIDLARKFDLPIVIHDRDAHREILDILEEKKQGPYKGVFHCFSGNYTLAMTLIEMGFYISIPGTVTFRNATQMQDVASRIPLERMLIETDAPFLTPVPFKGERNEPAFVIKTLEKIASLRGADPKVIARRTAENTRKLFKLPNRP